MGRECVLFCVPPCFVSTDNKCILLCPISPIGASCPLNESNEELRMKQWCLYFHSSFPFFSRLYNQGRDRFGVATIYLRRNKIKITLSSTGKRPTTQIQVDRGWKTCDPVERRELRTSLAVCDRKLPAKAVTGHVKGKVPDTSFSLIGVVYRNYTFKCSATTCLRNVCVSGVLPDF